MWSVPHPPFDKLRVAHVEVVSHVERLLDCTTALLLEQAVFNGLLGVGVPAQQLHRVDEGRQQRPDVEYQGEDHGGRPQVRD